VSKSCKDTRLVVARVTYLVFRLHRGKNYRSPARQCDDTNVKAGRCPTLKDLCDVGDSSKPTLLILGYSSARTRGYPLEWIASIALTETSLFHIRCSPINNRCCAVHECGVLAGDQPLTVTRFCETRSQAWKIFPQARRVIYLVRRLFRMRVDGGSR